jgi:diketogulonate reductase-like aldo/keto reductase
MSTYTLNNGVKIPAFGFGTWQIEEGEPAYQAVSEALKAGYIHIDTAAVYGNENSVGKAIQDSGIKREDLFITTKLWNADRGYESTLTAFEKSLTLLQMDYVDLYLIHWPANETQFENWQQINADTWKALEKLYVDGKVKAIGLSNFPKKYVEAVLNTAQIKPAVNQLEFHPGYLQEETVSYCKANEILVQAWSPLGSGRILQNEVLLALATKYGVSVGQICIKFALQEGINPLPKSTNPSNIQANLEVSNFELTPTDIQEIKSIGDLGFSGLNPAEVPF